MTDSVAPAPAAVSPKKGKASAAKTKNPRTAPAHPKTSDMVNNAIKNLMERGGSSLQAIKKYIASYYKVDAEKLAPFIRKHLKAAVASGALVQTKGKGAAGSFKLAKETHKAAPKKKVPAKEKKPKATGEKKKTAAKKTVAAKKVVVAKKEPAGVKKPKSPTKAKKAKVPAAKKPKPKRAVGKKSSPKKVAPKKK